MGKKLAIGLAAVAALAYRKRLRDWHLHWGATPRRSEPRSRATAARAPTSSRRAAISIDAPASAVWPWLVQMGPGRGGAYTYDWIENLFGLEMHSADSVHPNASTSRSATHLPAAADARHAGADPRAGVRARDRLGGRRLGVGLVLEPNGGGTRLISRNRIASGGSLGGRLGDAVMDPGSWVMERKMLHGIRQRAERLARDSAPAPAR